MRVLTPGGRVAGYDLVDSGLARVLHRLDGSVHRLATASAVRTSLGELSVSEFDVEPTLAGLVVRFGARRLGGTVAK